MLTSDVSTFLFAKVNKIVLVSEVALENFSYFNLLYIGGSNQPTLSLSSIERMIKMARTGKMICSCCGENKGLAKEYYASYSPLHSKIGVIPICKQCLNIYYAEILKRYNNNSMLAAKRFMLMHDVYWSEDIYTQSVNNSITSGVNWLSEYMRIKSNLKYRKYSSIDNIGIISEVENDIEVIINDNVEKKDVVSDDIIEKWGEGYTNAEYKALEKKYKMYTKEYPSNTLQHRNLIKSLCELEYKRNKARMEDNDSGYALFDKQISTKMAELDIIPSKQKRIDEESNMTFGTLMKAYETTEPVMDAQDVYKDVDFIEKYWNRIFAKPFAMAMGLAKGEYTLNEGDSNIEYTEEFKEVIKNTEDDGDVDGN